MSDGGWVGRDDRVSNHEVIDEKWGKVQVAQFLNIFLCVSEGKSLFGMNTTIHEAGRRLL
jgi:hypothetical protein